jgi:hypothetical protein
MLIKLTSRPYYSVLLIVIRFVPNAVKCIVVVCNWTIVDYINILHRVFSFVKFFGFLVLVLKNEFALHSQSHVLTFDIIFILFRFCDVGFFWKVTFTM